MTEGGTGLADARLATLSAWENQFFVSLIGYDERGGGDQRVSSFSLINFLSSTGWERAGNR